MAGEQGWVLQGVLSRAIFRRPPESGQKYFTVLSLHISNIYAKKKGIAKKLILTLRKLTWLQVGDLMVPHSDTAAKIDEAFLDSMPTPPRSIPDNWADVCGFFKPPGSQRSWKVNKHGAFSIPRKTLCLRPNDQSCHHETWLHLDFVGWSNTWSRQNVCEPQISLKERPAECSYGNPKRRISEINHE